MALLMVNGAANASAASDACPANADWLGLGAVLTVVLAKSSWLEAEAQSAEVDLVRFLALPA